MATVKKRNRKLIDGDLITVYNYSSESALLIIKDDLGNSLDLRFSKKEMLKIQEQFSYYFKKGVSKELEGEREQTQKESLTFSDVEAEIETYIKDVRYDLSNNILEEKEKAQIQFNSLLAIKAHLENIKQIGGQIFNSSIKLK